MHASVKDFLRRVVLPSDVSAKAVLEVGSRDVNGSPKEIIAPFGPSRYIGVDPVPGPGVDLVIGTKDIVEAFGPSSFDLVVSTEMLEHALDWKGAVRAMKRVTRAGGAIVLTARGPGFPYHPHPDDFWRFTVADMARAFSDWRIMELEPDSPDPGILLKAVRPDDAEDAADLETIEVMRVP